MAGCKGLNQMNKIDLSVLLESIKNNQLEDLLITLSSNPSFEVYIVGGAIRDSLSGLPLPSLDLDLMIKPSHQALNVAEIISSVTQKHYFVLDAERNTYRIQGDRFQIDVNGIRANEVIDDMFERDFSINSICIYLPEIVGAIEQKYSIVPVIDYFQGLADFSNHIIRAQNPRAFIDDPLRILRSFRFMALFSGSIGDTTLEAMMEARNLLQTVSKERIRDEFVKILFSSHAYPILLQMEETSILAAFFPFLDFFNEIDEKYTQKLQVKTHSLETMFYLEQLLIRIDQANFAFAREMDTILKEEFTPGRPKFVLLKIAGLLHDIGKPFTLSFEGDRLRFFDHEQKGAILATEWLSEMRFSNQEQDFISVLIENHMRPHNLSNSDIVTDKARYRFFRENKEESIPLLLLALADAYATKRIRMGELTSYESFVEDMVRFSLIPAKVKPCPFLDGTDVMNLLVINPSKEVGNLLEVLLEQQSLGLIKNREEAINFIKNKKTNNFV